MSSTGPNHGTPLIGGQPPPQPGFVPQPGQYPSYQTQQPGAYQSGAYQGQYQQPQQYQGAPYGQAAPPQAYPPATGQPMGQAAGQYVQGAPPQAYPPGPSQSVGQYGQGAPPQAYPPGPNQSAGQMGGKTPWDPNQATAYSGPDVATEDLDENHQMQEPQAASAPSYDLVVSGYENLTSGSDVAVGPPPPYEPPSEIEAALVDTSKIHSITDDQARDAMLALVAENACWGSGAAKNMKIKEITPTSAYHYTLETYTEGRSTKYTFKAYKGEYVDGPANGPAPMPWDIPCNPTVLFKTETHKIPVPHTEDVRTCHNCYGRGFTRCSRCWGRGNVRCSWCHGSGSRTTTNSEGHSHRTSCMQCHGRGRKRCMTCHGRGCVVCYVCEGYGSIKQYIELTVNYTDRLSDHIEERTDLPDHLIRNVQGDLIFEQTQFRVRPIENFFVPAVNSKSAEMVNSHSCAWPTERTLQQRHVLRSVPVHECDFKYGDKSGRFWVYGHQHSVFTEDYPHTCCCCRCVIA